VTIDLLNELKTRITIATKLEFLERKHKSVKQNANWFLKNAEELEIEVDETLYLLI
jgi:hypothetical protein